MKILHINTSDNGGAFQALYRLHLGLLKQGVDSKVLVLHQYNKNLKGVYPFLETIGLWERLKASFLYRFIEGLHQKLLKGKPKTHFTFIDTPYNVNIHTLVAQADIINLHWVANFVDIRSFFKKVQKPIVWSLHDMKPFSGGFHYETYYDENYKELDTDIRIKKQKIFKDIRNLSIVCLSKWLQQESIKSDIFGHLPHYLIPNSLDTDTFTTYDKQATRKEFGLPEDKKIVMFVADSIQDKRKGLKYLIDSMKYLDKKDILLTTIGELNASGHEIKSLGFIKDSEMIAKAYNCADVFVVPSLEDNLPNTVMEAMACGVPVVAFNVGGIPDMIQDNENGLLVQVQNSQELAQKINYLLENKEVRTRLGQAGFQTVRERYTLAIQAGNYINLYKSLLTKS
jgi:glycosyltransferase involved in cell wall biosynthesis